MNLKEYTKILNDTLEQVEKETGQQFSKDVEMLAIYKYLNTPVMKAAYPEISLIHDIKNDRYLMEYKAVGFYKFFGEMSPDGFDFRMKFGTNAMLLDGLKPMINEAIQTSANKMQTVLKNDSTFSEFINNVSEQDIDNIIAISDKTNAEFFKAVQFIKKDAPLTRDFLKLILKVMNKINQNHKFIDNHTEDRIYDMIKEGIAEGSDGLSQLRRLLHIQDIEVTNYNFDDIDDDEQFKMIRTIINESQPKNSISSLLLNDHENFIYNVFEQFVFENMKKKLNFTMQLIGHDLTVEQLYKENPIVDVVFNEALKRYPQLNNQPETFFQHLIIKDNDIYTQEKGVDYYSYINHIVEESSRADVMLEHFKTKPYKRSYTVIDPELDVEVVRFMGTTGHDVGYIFCANVDKNSDAKYKTLNLDTYLLKANLTADQLNVATKNVIDYCKKNELILCLDYKSMQQGLNNDEADIICETFDNAKNEICSIMLPSSSEKRKHALMSNIDLPYADIVKNYNKIGELIDAKMSDVEITMALKNVNKLTKLKM